MKVYKFGGASVQTAEGVENLRNIVAAEKEPLMVIVSAMGKTTNALEKVLDNFTEGRVEAAVESFDEVVYYHTNLLTVLFGDLRNVPETIMNWFSELETLIKTGQPGKRDYDYWYDRIVSYGELISTTIISEYLVSCGVSNRWLDMRQYFTAEGKHRDANIDLEKSAPLLKNEISPDCRVYIGQGFIAGTSDGSTFTLGREGSDYSAAAAGNILDAESVTIWKDVDGVLNADPKFFPDTVLIPELTYLDAIELAFSGAQIIHPKTIKPLQNKRIPLFVRPFRDPARPGSVIKDEVSSPVSIPILVLRRDQVLVSVRPKDFSFVIEDKLASIFALFEECGIKLNLIQSSAVNLSVCVDNTRRLSEVEQSLAAEGYRVVYNENMELLTIRSYTAELLERYGSGRSVYLTQKTRRSVRFVMKSH